MSDIRALAEDVDVEAIFLLSDALSKGFGIDKSESEAMDLLVLAAERGHLIAQSHLGFAYQSGDKYG